jgi:hypothetical protein
MNSTETGSTEIALKGIRRIAIWTIIVSLVVAAGIGIATIVSGDFGELQSKVLLTTLAVAAFAILALCHLAIINKDVRIVGWIGIGTSVVAFVAAAMLIWWPWDYAVYSGPNNLNMVVNKVFTISTLAAVSFAHANLMLLLASTPIRWMRVALDLNLVLIGLVPLIVVPVILTDGTFPPQSLADVYWRFFGVVLILDALGTVALPITSLIMRSQRHAAGVDHGAKGTVTVTLRGDTAAWVTERAESQKSTPLVVLESLVDAARKK